ncbi:MAG: sulfotransferase domain-containing protein [Leptolyngbyaceae cyanobacterium MO_188.B28]|nr:sulfotransferase domain-containing protein [Leptolyngbyaceae cyanobacterium MO_188.B28]
MSHFLLKRFSRYKNYVREKLTEITSPPVNLSKCVIHCCVQKTGSSWFLKVFSDRLFRNSAMLRIENPDYNYIPQPEGYIDRLSKINTLGAIICPLYVRPSDLKHISAPENTRCFFVVRDPRDLVISDYFSIRYSHPLINQWMIDKRKLLNELSIEEGVTERINDFRSYISTLREWGSADSSDIKIVKFEEIFGSNQEQEFKKLMQFCEVSIDDSVVTKLLRKYSFEKVQNRSPGKGKYNHYRSGSKNQWRKYFTSKHIELIKKQAGDLIVSLGYEENNDWE